MSAYILSSPDDSAVIAKYIWEKIKFLLPTLIYTMHNIILATSLDAMRNPKSEKKIEIK